VGCSDQIVDEQLNRSRCKVGEASRGKNRRESAMRGIRCMREISDDVTTTYET
jgi:hypothetical protein